MKWKFNLAESAGGQTDTSDVSAWAVEKCKCVKYSRPHRRVVHYLHLAALAFQRLGSTPEAQMRWYLTSTGLSRTPVHGRQNWKIQIREKQLSEVAKQKL